MIFTRAIAYFIGSSPERPAEWSDGVLYSRSLQFAEALVDRPSRLCFARAPFRICRHSAQVLLTKTVRMPRVLVVFVYQVCT